MNKTYLSLSVSRQLRGEFPIGDPFGGPAYGEKNMPFAAVGGAIAAAATAASSALGITAAAGAISAAVATGTGIGAAISLTVTAIANVAMVAGLAMTVVGVATGDKELMKIGGIVGLAGGVASLATSAISGMTGVLEGVNTMTGEALGASSADTVAMVGQNTASVPAAALTAPAGAATNAATPAVGSATNAATTANNAAAPAQALDASGQAAGQAANALPAANPANVGDTSALSQLGGKVDQIGSRLDGLDKWFAGVGKDTGLTGRDMIGIGGMAAQGIGSYMESQATLKSNEDSMRLKQAEFSAEQAANARAYANANKQGRLLMSAQLTPAQIAALPPDQQAAYIARRNGSAKINPLLTAPAGAAR